ncbi:MAG: hypothetical protein LBT10_02910 [Methanobrevibacter sp.]|nr:hypothetical protein [Methanobrevibacter sp.]
MSIPRHLKKIYKTDPWVDNIFGSSTRGMGGKLWKNLNYHGIFDTPINSD